MTITPNKDRPPECRDTCHVAQCAGSGCRFLHDEAHPVRVPPATDHIEDDLAMVAAADHIAAAVKVIDKQGTLIVEVPFEKKEGRHVRRNT